MGTVTKLQIDPDRCFYCETELDQVNRTRDHLIPKGQKGSNDPENIVNACRPCNSLKGNRTPFQFMKSMEFLRQATAVDLKEKMYKYNRIVSNTKRILDEWKKD